MDGGRRADAADRPARPVRLPRRGAGQEARIRLRQDGPWTYGVLTNHVWSFAGDDDREDVSNTFLQPSTTFGLNTESTYDWERERWTVPINATIAQLIRIGPPPVRFTLGARYYVERPAGGPDWGIRFVVTFLFPK